MLQPLLATTQDLCATAARREDLAGLTMKSCRLLLVLVSTHKVKQNGNELLTRLLALIQPRLQIRFGLMLDLAHGLDEHRDQIIEHPPASHLQECDQHGVAPWCAIPTQLCRRKP